MHVLGACTYVCTCHFTFAFFSTLFALKLYSFISVFIAYIDVHVVCVRVCKGVQFLQLQDHQDYVCACEYYCALLNACIPVLMVTCMCTL